MVVRGRIVVGVGAGSLFLSVILLLAGWTDTSTDTGGFVVHFDSLFLKVAAALGVVGVVGLLLGLHLLREAHSLREFNQAMEANRKKDE